MKDLTAERAAAKLSEQIRDDIGSCYLGSDDRGINLPWSGDWLGMLAGHIYRQTKTARQEALREAREKVNSRFKSVPTGLLGAGMQLGLREALAELDRLASEGASSPIDLSSKFNDDGGYGEHF